MCLTVVCVCMTFESQPAYVPTRESLFIWLLFCFYWNFGAFKVSPMKRLQFFSLNELLCVSELIHSAKEGSLSIVQCLWFGYIVGETATRTGLPGRIYLSSKWKKCTWVRVFLLKYRTEEDTLFHPDLTASTLMERLRPEEHRLLACCLQLPIHKFSLEVACF